MSKNFELLDDGTLDTVIQCVVCGEELRYTFDPAAVENFVIGESYAQFVETCFADAEETHDCDESLDREEEPVENRHMLADHEWFREDFHSDLGVGPSDDEPYFPEG